MAITTYQELLDAGANWLHRADLTARIPEFVALAEAKMNRLLKTAEMEASTTLTASSGTVALPTGFVLARRLRVLVGSIYQLVQIGPLRSDQSGTSGQPVVASVQGANLILNPAPNQSYTLALDYLAKFTPLSANNTSNWILASHPDAYLYGLLSHSAPFMGADARIQVWAQLFLDAINDIEKSDMAKRFSNLVMRTDVPSCTNGRYNIYTDQ